MTAGNEFEPPLSEGVRRCMKSNKSKDTSPELKVRRALREAGFPGYRICWKKAPGKPDICYPGRKVAVFINGCFWHRCPKCNLPLPKHNSDYWIPKLENNVRRDRRNIEALESDGWTVIVLWGCEVKKDFDSAMERVLAVLRCAGHR